MTRFDDYNTEGFFDEMLFPEGTPWPAAELLLEKIQGLPDGEMTRLQQAAERTLLNMGITFNVYSDGAGMEKIWPFDLLPRIIDASEWEWIERGLKQRIQALNLFIDDIYHDQKILKDGVIPGEIIRSATSFRPSCVSLDPPLDVWCHITGTDLIRDRDGQIYVLEDNLRCPSGASYVLQNRQLMKRGPSPWSLKPLKSARLTITRTVCWKCCYP